MSADRSAWRVALGDLTRLAVPLAVVQLGYHLTGMVDTIIAGRQDELTLAAAGLGANIFLAITVFGMGLALALDPLISQALGARREADVSSTLTQGLWVAASAAVPLSLAVLGIARTLSLFGVEPDLAHEATRYLVARLPSLLPLLIGLSLRAYLQAAKITRPIVLAMVLTNVLNAIADWLLLFGDQALLDWGLPAIGLPPLGTAGLGAASTLTAVLQAAVMSIAVWWHRRHESRGTATGSVSRRPSRKRMAQIYRVGLPVGGQLLAEVGIFTIVGVLIAGMGSAAMAAHQVALTLASLSFSVCLGIGAATSVVVGRAVGSQDTRLTRRGGVAGLALALAFMLLSTSIMWLFPETLAGLITDDPKVRHDAARLLWIAGVFQLVDGAQAVASGALRGAGVTRWSLVAHLVSHWLVGLPVGTLLAFGFGMGKGGLWWGLTFGLAAVAIALCAKFWKMTQSPIVALEL